MPYIKIYIGHRWKTMIFEQGIQYRKTNDESIKIVETLCIKSGLWLLFLGGLGQINFG